MSKNFGPSRGAGQVGNRLAGRYVNAETAPVEHAPATKPTVKPKMVTRSWYLPAETAEHLDQAADQLWRQLPGTSKHEVLAALLEAGIDRSEDVRQRLSQS